MTSRPIPCLLFRSPWVADLVLQGQSFDGGKARKVGCPPSFLPDPLSATPGPSVPRGDLQRRAPSLTLWPSGVRNTLTSLHEAGPEETMPEIKLPRKVIPGLRSLVALPREQAEELLRVLGEVPPSLDRRKIVAAVNATLPQQQSLFSHIIEALLGVESYRTYTDLSLSEFLNGVLASSDNIKDLGIEATQLPVFRDRLIRLLVTTAISVTGKATGVLTSHEHAFIGSRVFTDIRTVFKDEEGIEPLAPAAAVLVHMLRLRYSGSSEVNEFFRDITKSCGRPRQLKRPFLLRRRIRCRRSTRVASRCRSAFASRSRPSSQA